jgi:sugar lactone lactonase YvrE
MMMRIYSFSIIVITIIVTNLGNIALSQTTDYEVLVSSSHTHSVKRFHWPSGDYIDDFISPGSGGGLYATEDLTTGPDGNILVSGRGNLNILMYDRVSGGFIQPFTSGYFLDNPTKITYGPDGNLYVSQWGTTKSTVARFEGKAGQFIDEFTPDLNLPLGHFWDTEGNLYVACYGSKDVRTFDTAGTFLGVFTEAGHLQGPTNLWFDGEGSLFVVDRILGSVLEFNDSTGSFIGTFISGLQNAEGYAFGPEGNIYICDWSRNEVRRYSPEGNFIDVFADSGNMQVPNSILFRPVQLTSVNEETGNIPDKYFLSQNYPNPFNPETTIKYQIKHNDPVNLVIYDPFGQRVKTLVNEVQPAGSYQVVWDGKNHQNQPVSSGVYLYRLRSGNQILSKKMILLK